MPAEAVPRRTTEQRRTARKRGTDLRSRVALPEPTKEAMVRPPPADGKPGGSAATGLQGRSLRGRFVPEGPARSTRTGAWGRDSKHFAYPSEIGPRSSNKRKGMDEAVTTDVIARLDSDPFSSSDARSVRPLAGGKVKLKKAGMSRNHILADSRIRIIIEEIYDHPKRHARENLPAIREFFQSLVGDAQGDALSESFQNARTRGDLNAAVDEAAEGRVNLRIGNAMINSKVSNEFDPVVVDGRLSRDSARIRDAVIALQAKRLISFKSGFDALAVTKDRATGKDVTSTVLKSATLGTATGSRTRIDPFAVPADAPRRRYSVDLGVLDGAAAAAAAAREAEARGAKRRKTGASDFHYLSRPATDLAAAADARPATAGAPELSRHAMAQPMEFG
jgi:hypothetical protein